LREGWTRHQQKAAKHPLWSGRGGQSGEQVAFQITMSERRSGTYNTAQQKEFRNKLRNSMTAAECVL